MNQLGQGGPRLLRQEADVALEAGGEREVHVLVGHEHEDGGRDRGQDALEHGAGRGQGRDEDGGGESHAGQHEQRLARMDEGHLDDQVDEQEPMQGGVR